MINRFDIQPYVGVGDIKFGMNQNQIANLIGPSPKSKKGFLGEVTESRRDNGLSMTYGKDSNELVEIGVSKNITELEFGGKYLFTASPLNIFDELVKYDGNPYEYVGFVILLKLGITLTGFHDGDENQKAVTVFAKGRWDDQLADLKPFKWTPHSPAMDMDKALKLPDNQAEIAARVELGTTIRTGQVCPQDGIWEATVGGEKLFIPKGGNVPYVRSKLPQKLAQKMTGKFSYANAEETTWVLREYRDKSGKLLA